VNLQAVNTYWNGNVKTKGIHFKNYHVGYLDSMNEVKENQAIKDLKTGKTHLLSKFIIRNLTKAQEAVGIKYYHLISTCVQTTCFNMYHPIVGTGLATPLGTADAAKFIRQAVNHIIPRKKIINQICLGVGFPGVTYVNPYDSMIGWDELLEPYEYNISRAKELMEKAGYEYPSSDPTSTTTSSSMPTTESITTPSFEILVAFVGMSTLRLLMIIKRHKHRNQRFPD
jgi:ABC-type transport system substrate-binding protein